MRAWIYVYCRHHQHHHSFMECWMAFFFLFRFCVRIHERTLCNRRCKSIPYLRITALLCQCQTLYGSSRYYYILWSCIKKRIGKSVVLVCWYSRNKKENDERQWKLWVSACRCWCCRFCCFSCVFGCWGGQAPCFFCHWKEAKTPVETPLFCIDSDGALIVINNNFTLHYCYYDSPSSGGCIQQNVVFDWFHGMKLGRTRPCDL